MRLAPPAARLVAAIGRRLAGAAAGVGRLVDALAYRRQELAVVGLLAGSVVLGFGVERWHRRAPAMLDRLEGEPPRIRAVPGGPGSRAAPPPRPTAPDELAPRRRGRGPGGGDPPRGEAPRGPAAAVAAPVLALPLDLGAATPEDLARLPGIGPRLAARIVERRTALGGRFASFDEFARTPGLGRARAARLRGLVAIGAQAGESEPPAVPGGEPP